MDKRFFFPVFNGLICALVGALVGYGIGHPIPGTLCAAALGVLIGAVVEAAFGRSASRTWLYRRRALLAIVAEIPLAIFVVGPYAYVWTFIQPDHHAVCCETPLDHGAASYENVRIETPDGIVLAGWYVPPQHTPGAVIILLPGSGADRRGTAWHAQQLIAAGYGALMYDPRGMGESTGDTVSLGWQYRGDLLAATAYLQARPDVDPTRIAALGLSRGAHVAINAADLMPDCFAGLWLDGMQSQRLEDYPQARNAGERFEMALEASILRMAEIELGEPLPPAIGQMLQELDRPPMTIIASGLDPFERQIHEKYIRFHRPSQDMWLIENAGHTGGPNVNEAQYRQRMLAFFATVFETPAGACSSTVGE